MIIRRLANGGGKLKASSVHLSRLLSAGRNPFDFSDLKSRVQAPSGSLCVAAFLLLCGSLLAVACSEEDGPTPDPALQGEELRDGTRTEPGTPLGEGQVQMGDVIINTQWDGEEHYTY